MDRYKLGQNQAEKQQVLFQLHEAEQETLRGQPIRLSRTPVRHKTKKLVLLEIPIIDQTGKPDCNNEQQRKLKKRKTEKLKKDVELNNPEI